MTKQLSTRLMMVNYALTTLLSALLLFQVQPIISKFILPWFGGSPAVWTTCMVFFQTVLFAGYAYAHFSVQFLRPRWQVALHLALLAAAVAMLPIAPDVRWKLEAASSPTWRILCLLGVSVGLPYFALSATGPLVQAWFCRSFANRSPYRLYALSNVGSLAGLLAYPFFVEPRFAIASQTWYWAAGFAAFAALCALCALSAAWARHPEKAPASRPADSHAAAPTARQRLAWLLLPALASMMLLATTNHVCQDVAVIPFLWVAPLSLYLLSFIISFDHPRWYRRTAFAVTTLVTLGAITLMDQMITAGSGVAFDFRQELALHLFGLFALCMVCHGELYRLRPDPRHLTGFYLMISAGGALGGMFVSLVAPRIFSTFAEWRLGLVAGCFLAAWIVLDGRRESFLRRRFAAIAGALLLVFVAIYSAEQLRARARNEVFQTARNFYGVIAVQERDVDDPARRAINFYSGRIVHGLQFTDPARRREPTAYFGRQTGVARALAAVQDRPSARVGIVGLGVGTLAAYARPNQYFRFYEINDQVLRFADDYFTYLDDCAAKHDVVLGDGRLSLEFEQPQNFDLLILDAFSGDAVPTHLLTKEAFEIYGKHLRDDSLIAVNISNRYLDLAPVLAGVADHFGYAMRQVHSPGNPELGQFPADWVLLARRPGLFAPAETRTAEVAGAEPTRKLLWTDDHSNLFEILK